MPTKLPEAKSSSLLMKRKNYWRFFCACKNGGKFFFAALSGDWKEKANKKKCYGAARTAIRTCLGRQSRNPGASPPLRSAIMSNLFSAVEPSFAFPPVYTVVSPRRTPSSTSFVRSSESRSGKKTSAHRRPWRCAKKNKTKQKRVWSGAIDPEKYFAAERRREPEGRISARSSGGDAPF